MMFIAWWFVLVLFRQIHAFISDYHQSYHKLPKSCYNSGFIVILLFFGKNCRLPSI